MFRNENYAIVFYFPYYSGQTRRKLNLGCIPFGYSIVLLAKHKPATSDAKTRNRKGEVMSLNDALMFVNKMKEDNHFRDQALETSNPEDLSLFLHTKGLKFDQRELVGAMAACMTQMEQQMGD